MRKDVERRRAVLASEADTLLSRVATGDQGAFASLYDLLSARVLGLVVRVLVDRSQAEEVTQEVFLEVWQSAPRYDAARGTAVTWVLTMAHRRAIDRVRAAQASRDRDLREGIRGLDREYDSVTETVEVRMEHERVQRAMARLTPLQREALQLAYYGGYTSGEVAVMLQVPIGTVKTRLRDGLIRLRDELGVVR
ncbi:MAG TPA: ECF RNA polymerase sigma factor SigK [Naasia sp.]